MRGLFVQVAPSKTLLLLCGVPLPGGHMSEEQNTMLAQHMSLEGPSLGAAGVL